MPAKSSHCDRKNDCEDDCEPQCEPKCEPKCKPKCDPKLQFIQCDWLTQARLVHLGTLIFVILVVAALIMWIWNCLIIKCIPIRLNYLASLGIVLIAKLLHN